MTTQKGANDPIDPKLVRKLADILRETELSEIEVEQGDLKIRVARQLTAAPAASLKDAIKSPMVGTVYMAPQPGAAAFIKVGDKVKQGQTLLIIEAMKTMNPIPSPREGVVAQILVGDAQPVEFGEPLVVFE